MLLLYNQVCKILMDNGSEVLSLHVIDPELEDKESRMSEQQIYERDMGLLEQAGCMIAEVSVASTGVGYEVCSAIGLGMPVLCIYEKQANVSSMILGNTNKNLDIRQYSS